MRHASSLLWYSKEVPPEARHVRAFVRPGRDAALTSFALPVPARLIVCVWDSCRECNESLRRQAVAVTTYQCAECGERYSVYQVALLPAPLDVSVCLCGARLEEIHEHPHMLTFPELTAKQDETFRVMSERRAVE